MEFSILSRFVINFCREFSICDGMFSSCGKSSGVVKGCSLACGKLVLRFILQSVLKWQGAFKLLQACLKILQDVLNLCKVFSNCAKCSQLFKVF